MRDVHGFLRQAVLRDVSGQKPDLRPGYELIKKNYRHKCVLVRRRAGESVYRSHIVHETPGAIKGELPEEK